MHISGRDFYCLFVWPNSEVHNRYNLCIFDVREINFYKFFSLSISTNEKNESTMREKYEAVSTSINTFHFTRRIIRWAGREEEWFFSFRIVFRRT